MLQWVAQGKTNAEIGCILDMSPGTVKKHLRQVYEKLGVETRTAAAALALGWRSGRRKGSPPLIDPRTLRRVVSSIRRSSLAMATSLACLPRARPTAVPPRPSENLP